METSIVLNLYPTWEQNLKKKITPRNLVQITLD